MLTIVPKEKDTLDSLLKRYKERVRSIGLIDKGKNRRFFVKKSERRRKAAQRASFRERYKRTHELA